MGLPADHDPAVLASQTTNRQRIPDFFIVGHPKCGTTALYEMLRAHPQIFMPSLKETRFFAPELHPGTRSDGVHPATLEQYLSLFAGAPAGQRAGEASPSYLRSESAAERISEIAPQARIVAILREPASFVSSLHLELLRDHVETEKDLARALAQEQDRMADLERRPGLVYAQYVNYVEQLRRYHDRFGRDRVLILIYDDFLADNAATVRRVLRFLEVDETQAIQRSEANRTVRVRSPGLYALVRSLYLGRGRASGTLKSAIKAVTPRRVRRAALDRFRRRVLYGQPQAPDEQLTAMLKKRFKGEVVAVSAYLERDLVREWGYDSVA